MGTGNKIFYGACALTIAVAAYLGQTKEMVCQTFKERMQSSSGDVAYVIEQEDNFHPFKGLRFKAPTHFIAQAYTEEGKVGEKKTFRSESKARRFAGRTLEELNRDQ